MEKTLKLIGMLAITTLWAVSGYYSYGFETAHKIEMHKYLHSRFPEVFQTKKELASRKFDHMDLVPYVFGPLGPLMTWDFAARESIGSGFYEGPRWKWLTEQEQQSITANNPAFANR